MTDHKIVNMTLYGEGMSDYYERIRVPTPESVRSIEAGEEADYPVDCLNLLAEIDRLTKKLELYDKALIRKAQLEDDVVLLKQENKELRERLKGIEKLYERWEYSNIGFCTYAGKTAEELLNEFWQAIKKACEEGTHV